MDRANKQATVIALEQRILRHLCAGGMRAQEFAAVRAGLAGHKWLHAEHRIVWEALLRVPEGSAELREMLPAEAARMGFPDVEWGDYFPSWLPALEVQESFNAEGAEGRREHGDGVSSDITDRDATDLAPLARQLKELTEE